MINGWDLGQDDSYASLVRELVYVDWGHMAPPCRTLSRSRRIDKYGSVPVSRTNGKPYGHGKEDADVNLLVECCVGIAEEQMRRQTYFSIENPKDSLLLMLKYTTRLSKYPGIRIVELDQCAYGGPHYKPLWIPVLGRIRMSRSLLTLAGQRASQPDIPLGTMQGSVTS